MLKFGLEREGGLGGNTKGIEDAGLELCRICLRSGYSTGTFSVWSQRGGI